MYRRRLLGVLVGCLTVAASALTVSPSEATSSPSATLSVTILLAPQSRIGLDALAAAPRLNPSQRRALLAQVAPTSGTAARAVRRLTALGLRVEVQNPFAVQVSGSAAQITALFGSTRDAAGVRGRVPLHLPPGLRTLATAAVGGDDAPLALRPAATPGADYGAQVRRVYSAPATPGTITPTIATVQFSGFQSSDLSSFATGNGLPDPVASGQFTAISVDGASPSTSVAGGDVEFALDQEALLATAPTTRQRAYVAPSTTQGFVDILNSIATDSSASHIVTAASSWGICESVLPGADRSAIHAAITNLTAAGVTFFAATGDAGSNDCLDSPPTTEVDFPASDPLTVAVGGTTLPASGPQTAWTDGGGGLSQAFSRPAYQASATAATSRAVPDIALEADPDINGFPAIRQGHPLQVGGTSLSAQLAAATFTNTIVGRGATGGIGDIHSALYTAQTCGFSDVTAGSNGAYDASTGFDLTTGLGAPAWSRLAYALLPSTVGGAYVPLCPTRILDTRRTAPVPAGGTLTVQITGSHGVPAHIRAIAVNLTAVATGGHGYITAYAAGSARPKASNLNVATGHTVANLALVPVSASGQITLYNGVTGPANLLVDIEGYYVSGASTDPGTYTPLESTARILDSRISGAPVAAGGTITISIAGGHGIPAGITAAAVNVTLVQPSARGYVTAYAANSPPPGTSTLNFVTGQTVANLAIVPVSPSGQITLRNGSTGTVQLILDVQGYLRSGTPTDSGSYRAQSPSRILDTRLNGGPIGGRRSITLHLTGAMASATAVALNLTATSPTDRGYITAYPSGTPRPPSSSLNFVAGQTVANLVIVPVGPDGTITIFDGSPGSTQLLADLEGYVLP